VDVPDLVVIRGLLLRTIIGVNDEERHNLQDVVIDITVETDTHTAGRTDDVRHAVNYRTITKEVVSLVQASSYFLVERLAEEIARVCLAQPRALAATVQVAKPGAVRFARSVGVEIRRERVCPPDRHWIYVLLGANIDPVANLQRAAVEIASGVDLVSISPVYETAPVGNVNQPPFLNAAALVETSAGPDTLKEQILRPIEQRLGRVRTADPNGPRTIDLDIVLMGGGSLSRPWGQLLDPSVVESAHSLVPLADLAPTLVPRGRAVSLQAAAVQLGNDTVKPRPDVCL